MAHSHSQLYLHTSGSEVSTEVDRIDSGFDGSEVGYPHYSISIVTMGMKIYIFFKSAEELRAFDRSLHSGSGAEVGELPPPPRNQEEA